MQRGCRLAVITLGAKGAVIVSPSTSYLVAAPLVPNVVDTSGAGDSFIGALANQLARRSRDQSIGGDIREAVEFACETAAVSVTRKGTQASYASKEELREIKAKASAK